MLRRSKHDCMEKTTLYEKKNTKFKASKQLPTGKQYGAVVRVRALQS